jgi:hypothetical protein
MIHAVASTVAAYTGAVQPSQPQPSRPSSDPKDVVHLSPQALAAAGRDADGDGH